MFCNRDGLDDTLKLPPKRFQETARGFSTGSLYEGKMKRYSAKLLFQYCEKINKKAVSKRRLCEERIITINAESAREALAIAKKRGIAAKFDFKTLHNTTTYFEFIGIKELLCLDYKCESDEVWYEHRYIHEPMERKTSLVPAASGLEAIKNRE
jgi:Domain of unknown function (DUF4288)